MLVFIETDIRSYRKHHYKSKAILSIFYLFTLISEFSSAAFSLQLINHVLCKCKKNILFPQGSKFEAVDLKYFLFIINAVTILIG